MISLKKTALGSAALHGLFLLFCLRSWHPQMKMNIRPTMRVDMIALPQRLKNQHHFSPDNTNSTNQQKKNIGFQKAQQAIAFLRSEQQTTDNAPKKQYEGNRLSFGVNQEEGAQTSLTRNYLHELQHHLKENWYLPIWLQELHLSCQVRIFIADNGNLIRYEFIKTSGNKEFDAFVKAAIEQSNPFNAPPKNSPEGKDVLINGVLLGFPI